MNLFLTLFGCPAPEHDENGYEIKNTRKSLWLDVNDWVWVYEFRKI